MALHPEINPNPEGLPLSIAAAALRAARASKTSHSGSAYFETGSTADGDGVGIVTGPMAAEHGGIGRLDDEGVLHPLVDIAPLEQAAQAAQAQADSVREQAAKDAQTLREQMEQVAADADKASEQAQELAQSALDAANKADGKADSVTATVNGHESKLKDLSASLESTRKTADGALEKSSKVEASVGELSATLTRDYTPTSKADAKYAAKTELTATAEGLQSKITQAATTADSAVTTANEAKSTADKNTATISQVSAAAQGALDKASSVEQSLDGFKTTVSSTYQPKGNYQPKGDYATKTELNQTADSITSSVAKTYQPKGDYATNSALSSYATKTELSQTANSITSSVSATAKTAQSALDKASTVEQTASGLSSRISEVASTASGAVTTANEAVKTTSQVSQRVDSLSSTITQVQGDVDRINVNSQNFITNPQFKQGNIDGVANTNMNATDSNPGVLPGTATTFGKNYGGYDNRAENVKIKFIKNHTYRIEIDARLASDNTYTGAEGLGLFFWFMTADNPGLSANQYTSYKADLIPAGTKEWTHASYNYTPTMGDNDPRIIFRPAYRVPRSSRWLVTNFTCTDVTAIAKAQKDANTANSTANSALSQASSVEQTLDSFKTSVSQTYQPKGDYATNSGVAEHYATKSSLEQTANGIKTEVSQKYQAKGDYATKTELSQTSTSLTAKISTAQNTANTANGTANSAKTQANNLDTLIRMDTNGVRVGKIVSGKYAGCSCLMNANGSFDVIDSDNNIVARFDANRVTLAGGVFNVGVIGGEDLYIGAQPLNMQQYESGLVIGRKGNSTLLQGYQQAVLSSVGGNVSIFGKSGVDIDTGAGKLTVNGQVWDSVTLYKSGGWAIVAFGKVVTISANNIAIGGGSWDTLTCPYKLPEQYRPAGEINNAANVTNNIVTRRIYVSADGTIKIGNIGGAGSTQPTYASITYVAV